MDLSDKVLGKTATQHLRESHERPVLIIGSDAFTRGDLAGVECFNFLAAANLTRIAKGLKVKNTDDLFHRISPHDLALPRMGAVALAVLGAAFEKMKLGGSSPLESYVKLHLRQDIRAAGEKADADTVEQSMVTWNTLKGRELTEIREELKARRLRKAARRDIAHGKRVERFEKRAAAAEESGQ